MIQESSTDSNPPNNAFNLFAFFSANHLYSVGVVGHRLAGRVGEKHAALQNRIIVDAAFAKQILLPSEIQFLFGKIDSAHFDKIQRDGRVLGVFAAILPPNFSRRASTYCVTQVHDGTPLSEAGPRFHMGDPAPDRQLRERLFAMRYQSLIRYEHRRTMRRGRAGVIHFVKVPTLSEPEKRAVALVSLDELPPTAASTISKLLADDLADETIIILFTEAGAEDNVYLMRIEEY